MMWGIDLGSELLLIGSFDTIIYRYGHYLFCKRCSTFGHVSDDCSAVGNLIVCFKCDENHLFGACPRNVRKCFRCYSNINLRRFAFNHQFGDSTCLTVINYLINDRSVLYPIVANN